MIAILTRRQLLCLLLLVACHMYGAVILQKRGIGYVPDIEYNMAVAGASKECTHVIAEGQLRHLYLFVRFDHLGEVQASIQDFFMSIRIVQDDISLALIDHSCFQIGGFNFFDINCEYFGAWPAASIFSPDDNPLEVANYYLDFSRMRFGRAAGTGTVNGSSSTYEVCVGNGWQASLGPVQYRGNIVFSNSELTLTGLPPTASPTALPSLQPTSAPTSHPSASPTFAPSPRPSPLPSFVTGTPTSHDYISPTSSPTLSLAPSFAPSAEPSTASPSSSQPTPPPSCRPSLSPTRRPSARPSAAPTATHAPSATPLLVQSACSAPLALSFAAALDAQEAQCLLVPMSGSAITALNISLLFTRQPTSFTESPVDLTVVVVNTATGAGLQAGGTAITDSRVSRLQAWPASWNHMHVASGVSSKVFSALVDLTSFQMGGDGVYSVCLKNSFYFSAGVRYDGSLMLGGMSTACGVALPVPSAPATLAPSISAAPTASRRQVLRQSSTSQLGVQPTYLIDAVLRGGEEVCVETVGLAGTPSSLQLQLAVWYLRDSPGASWASDLAVTVSSRVNGSYSGGSGHCAHVTGDASAAGAEAAGACLLAGTWPAQLNSGVSGLVYSNISVPLSLSTSLARNLAAFNTKQVFPEPISVCVQFCDES